MTKDEIQTILSDAMRIHRESFGADPTGARLDVVELGLSALEGQNHEREFMVGFALGAISVLAIVQQSVEPRH